MMKYVSKSQNKEDVDEFQQIITLLSFPSFIYRENFSSFGKGRQVKYYQFLTTSCLCDQLQNHILFVEKLKNRTQKNIILKKNLDI